MDIQSLYQERSKLIEKLETINKLIALYEGSESTAELMNEGYPFNGGFKEKILYALETEREKGMKVKDIRNLIRKYEPSLNVANLNQFCAALAKQGAIISTKDSSRGYIYRLP